MGIGGSIFLIALGAILAFAVHASLGFVSIQVVGWVLMVAGVVGLILTLWFWSNRRRTAVVDSRTVDSRAVDPRYDDPRYDARVDPRVPAQPLPPDDTVVDERRRTTRYPNQY